MQPLAAAREGTVVVGGAGNLRARGKKHGGGRSKTRGGSDLGSAPGKTKWVANRSLQRDWEARSPPDGCRGRLKYQRVNAHREAAQFNGIVSGRPASAWGKATARLGPPDTTFFTVTTWSSNPSTPRNRQIAPGGKHHHVNAAFGLVARGSGRKYTFPECSLNAPVFISKRLRDRFIRLRDFAESSTRGL
jgi:hypothetical protein